MKTTVELTQSTYPNGDPLYRIVINGFIQEIVTATEDGQFIIGGHRKPVATKELAAKQILAREIKKAQKKIARLQSLSDNI